jgi:hypothetical protein
MMAWTAPRTWVTAEVVTAALLNTHVRDNLLQTAPALVTTKGDLVGGTAANTLNRLAVGTNDYVLIAASGETTGLKWGIDPLQDKYTAKGDLLVATAANVGAALNVGANNTVLTADSGEATGLKWGVVNFTLEGSNNTEVTTTSTSEVDLVTVSSLTIQVTEVFMILAGWRRTTGASCDASFGLKINSTTVIATTDNPLGHSGSVNEAMSGTLFWIVPSRVTNYFGVGMGLSVGNSGSAPLKGHGFQSADVPNAEITSITITAKSGSSSVTLGVDEVRVYVLPSS